MIPPMICEKRSVAQVLHVSPIASDPAGLIPIRSRDVLPNEMPLWRELIAETRPLTIPPHSRAAGYPRSRRLLLRATISGSGRTAAMPPWKSTGRKASTKTSPCRRIASTSKPTYGRRAYARSRRQILHLPMDSGRMALVIFFIWTEDSIAPIPRFGGRPGRAICKFWCERPPLLFISSSGHHRNPLSVGNRRLLRMLRSAVESMIPMMSRTLPDVRPAKHIWILRFYGATR